MNRIGGVMVRVLAFSAIDLGFETNGVMPMMIQFVFVAFPLSTQHLKEKG